jgi:tetratricopeptide (TPR) repeat protein
MRRLIASFRALLLLLLIAAPLPLAAADYNDNKALDELFSQLKIAPDASAAEAITQVIWAYWFNPIDKTLSAKLADAMRADVNRDYRTCLAILDKMVADYPDFAEGWNRRATVYYELGNYEGSLADIEKVLALEPRHFGALSGKVMIELQQGNRAAALRDLVVALAIHPYLGIKQAFPELNQSLTNT